MDISSKKLVRLLHADQPEEVREAALLVVGELGIKDAEINGELLARLDDDVQTVRIRAIGSIGKLKITKALPRLLERIKNGGPESIACAEASAKLGDAGVKGLQELLHTVAPGVRKYIAAALTNADSGDGQAGLSVLRDTDPQIVTAAANSIILRLSDMTEERKGVFVAELVRLAKDRKNPLPPVNEQAVMKILTAVNDPVAAGVMWDRVLPPHPVEMRAAALLALGGWTLSPSKDQLRRLFRCAADSHFQIAAPALMMLNKLPNIDKHVAEWLELLTAPDIAARRLALEKIGSKDSPEVAAALMEQLGHPDRQLRETASERLVHTENGRQALADSLMNGTTAEAMWPTARTLAAHVRSLSEATRSGLFAAACRQIEAGDARMEPLLFVLREAGASDLRDRLFEQAVAKRKKKNYEAALKYLKHVARDPAAGWPMRLELAMVGLKLSSHDLATDARSNDRSLPQFEHLVEQDSEAVLKAIEKAKWLDADDLFYLGFHFAEHFDSGKVFGAAVLRLVIQLSPKSKVAGSAKNKLKTIAL